ncbi:hypothetical protein K457DRAFT_25754 [Linnemannia elongata AG-77]|uniref:Uncharacterized protein n=1 Tax=Linnemannia elongata AG-77 TaxID=1314771 RepID=A0A197JC82_9FUNG|nr:hypothetical protein K457DRAFT_25754 [Linnemannia elongata AG-77]
MSRNTIFFGTPRLIDREDDLYLSDPETTIASYEPPTVLPPTIQDHHEAVQVQLDAAQALSHVLIVVAVMIAVAALPKLHSLHTTNVHRTTRIIGLTTSTCYVSYTCHELFYITAPADWYSLATYTYTNWVQSCGGPKARDWKTMVLKDAALGVRLGATLPLPDVISSTSSSTLTTASSPSTSALSLPILGTSLATRTVVTPSKPSPHLPPLFTDQWVTSASSRLPSSLDDFNRCSLLRVKLSEIQFFETDRETQDTPGASWEKDQKTDSQHQPWYHPFTCDQMQVAQVVEIKHYPENTIGGMRVVVVIAFGQRAHPWVNNATASHLPGVWLMPKVIEFGAYTIGVAPEQAHDIVELVEVDDGEVELESVEDDKGVEHEFEEPYRTLLLSFPIMRPHISL